MFDQVIDQINANVIFGSGVGDYDTTGPFGGIIPHNLFLAAWSQSGILALIAASGFYIVGLLMLLRSIAFCLSD